MKYIDTLRNSLDKILKKDKKIVLLGEDISDPYGGAFKVTKGLSSKYPEQIISTPMSESALAGICVGMALNGYKPILEIMFGDFITLCADQIINHASKFKFIFEKDLNMIIRTPMGGYRGYGATHSQSLEKIYFGIPNIYIFTPNILINPGELLEKAINYKCLVIFIENKLDYSRELITENDKYSINRDKNSNLVEVNINGENEFEGYIITYGGMVEMALEIIWEIFIEQERSLKLIIPSIISPIDKKILNSIEENKEIYILEEGIKEGGFSSEISRLLLENNIRVKKFQVFAAKNEVIGASKFLENYVLPDKSRIIKQIMGRN